MTEFFAGAVAMAGILVVINFIHAARERKKNSDD